MRLDEYTREVLEALEADPGARLAISFGNLLEADDTDLIGLDLFWSYIRTLERSFPEHTSADVNEALKALDLHTGKTRLLNDQTLLEAAEELSRLGGDLLDLEEEWLARDLVERVIESEPMLTRVVADRQRQVGKRNPCSVSPYGVALEEHLPHIKRTLDSDPEARLAISLSHLEHAEEGRRLVHATLVQKWVEDVDHRSLTGQLAEDARRFLRAHKILRGRIGLNGSDYLNFRVNMDGLGSHPLNLVPSTEARRLISRIMKAVPELYGCLTDYERPIPY